MIKFLAAVAAFALVFVALPAQAEAQQIVVPPCPSDADCHFRGGVSERESIRVWNNGGGPQYPPPPVYAYPQPQPQYYGGSYRQQCGNRGGWYVGVQSADGSLCIGGGGGNRQGYAQGGYAGQGGGPGVQRACAPGEIQQGNTCSGCRPGLVFAQHPQTGQLVCVVNRR